MSTNTATKIDALYLHPVSVSDLDEIVSLERRCHLAPWSAESIKHELSRENRIAIGSSVQKTLVGYCLAYIVCDEVHLLNVAVHPDFRRNGIAGQLLEELFSIAYRLDGRTIYLEVRVSNQVARNLYRGFGFTEVGVRKNYYRNNQEDAVLMQRPIGSNVL